MSSSHWIQEATGADSTVCAVSDYAVMPSTKVRSPEVKSMMTHLDALPFGYVGELSAEPDGQWTTTVTKAVKTVSNQFFPSQEFLHQTVLRGVLPPDWHHRFPEDPFLLMWKRTSVCRGSIFGSVTAGVDERQRRP